MGWLARLFGDRTPEGFDGVLDPGEHVLDSAEVTGGGLLVVTPLGLWIPGPRRVGWHLIAKAAWRDDLIELTESDEVGTAGDAVFLADRAPVRFGLERSGKVPKLIWERVEGSIRSRYRKDLADGGGAWFVQRKVPGRDGAVLQVRADPGTDRDVVAAIAREAAEKLATPEL
ncbi:MAG: hypothetical protein JWQ81_3025 [Amycolatopsis sp.]|jgi:hypothetical protein|uniref:hypothetical protein n=1 Tax=Amycolatopsis sp. TaxID=37632 RepID=UPI00262A9443|nr:hypothetical protein [Amycolatopsis sp.]MCU1682286.1 hypothetical protein [Amycolatopsis sp.]